VNNGSLLQSTGAAPKGLYVNAITCPPTYMAGTLTAYPIQRRGGFYDQTIFCDLLKPWPQSRGCLLGEPSEPPRTLKAGQTANRMTNLDTAIGAERFRALSSREKQIATLVCDGLANKEIARELCVCEGTVKQHVHSIYRKLSVRNRGGLIVALLQPKN
jgi:DNA-binding CsgD family transcriptional regulator